MFGGASFRFAEHRQIPLPETREVGNCPHTYLHDLQYLASTKANPRLRPHRHVIQSAGATAFPKQSCDLGLNCRRNWLTSCWRRWSEPGSSELLSGMGFVGILALCDPPLRNRQIFLLFVDADHFRRPVVQPRHEHCAAATKWVEQNSARGQDIATPPCCHIVGR